MEIFLSWSGERSGACANALKDWLPCVLQYLKPWVSSHDIAKGDRGALEIAKKLDEFNFGIVCLASDNLHNDWILFESGALSKRLDTSAVYTFLLDLKPADISPPLGQFQHTTAEKHEVLKLLQSINLKHSSPLPDSVLQATFEKFWPDLEKVIKGIPSASRVASDQRPEREILEEILTAVRDARSLKTTAASEVPANKSGILNAFIRGYAHTKTEKIDVKRIQVAEDMFVIYLLVDGEESKFLIPMNMNWRDTEAQLISEVDSATIPF